MFRDREDQVIKVGAFHSLLKLLQRLMGISAVLALVAGPELARAVPAPIRGHMEPIALDSGALDNWRDVSAVVYSQIVDLGPDVSWVRVIFSEVNLPPGSFVRITSLEDGDSQILDAVELQNWGYGTAFFNGSRVQIEVIAGARTRGNRIQVAEVFAGEVADAGPGGAEGVVADICPAGGDSRTPSEPGDASYDKRVARLLPGKKQDPGDNPNGGGGGTAFLVDTGVQKILLSAGHNFPGARRDNDLTVQRIIQF